jgi:hypothetical protein
MNSRQRQYRVIAGAMFFFLASLPSLGSFGDELEANTNVVRILGEIWKAFEEDRLTPHKVERLLEVELSANADHVYWHGQSCGIYVIVHAGEYGQKATRVDLNLQFGSGVKLADIVALFGEYNIVHESKTSSVRFERVSTLDEGRYVIFAGLLAPEAVPAAPVQSVSFRRR